MSRPGVVALGILAVVVNGGAAPVHPERLNEKLRHYVATRVGEFDSIPQERRDQLRKLASYIRDKMKADRPARLVFICTHNSRRSQMCQLWAATAAAYFGVPHVENFSGGTEVTAFNSRAVAALRARASRSTIRCRRRIPTIGSDFTTRAPNWNASPRSIGTHRIPGATSVAVITCSQADKQCPIVAGASARIALPFDDPKAFDGTPQETNKYDERRRQIARELLFVFSEVGA